METAENIMDQILSCGKFTWLQWNPLNYATYTSWESIFSCPYPLLKISCNKSSALIYLQEGSLYKQCQQQIPPSLFFFFKLKDWKVHQNHGICVKQQTHLKYPSRNRALATLIQCVVTILFLFLSKSFMSLQLNH